MSASGAGPLTAVSLFAGIGGLDLACEQAGITVTAAAEIDPACRSVLTRHFPATTLFRDVTEVTGAQLRATGFVPRRGVLTAGFPCQDLSVAGRRTGLAGARSGLFWHVMRLADELSPQWILLENVPGLLSAVCPCPGDGTCTASACLVRCGGPADLGPGRSAVPAHAAHPVPGGACSGGCMQAHGGALGTVLGALGQRGYGFAYRVLDAQFFGVPQRRERVFIAGCLGDRAAPVQVLLEPESSGRHPAQSHPQRPHIAGTLGSRAGGSRTTDLDGHGAYIVSTLQGGGPRGHRLDAESAAGGHLVPVAHAITAREGKGSDSDATTGFIVTHTLTAEGADASEDGTGRGTPLVLASTGAAVRRLTPLECERLQGFPDRWTAGQSDSARYRQLGNAVAVPVAAWITHRIAAAQPDASLSPGGERRAA